MNEVIKKENMAVGAEAGTWKEAVDQAGRLLVKSGSIDVHYIEEMKQSIEKLGPYIVLMPGFALIHSAPSASVKSTGLSLITLQEPVKFGSPNDPVSVVMCLACVDKVAHMERLKTIANKFLTDGIVESMKNCRTVDALYELINS